MKTLPDAASIDHLRRQAKDLLAQLQIDRPEATLTEAQTMLAGQYGFRDWPELKAEVDRRAAAAPSVDHDAAVALAEAFDLGRPTGPLVAHEREWAGQDWTFTTERGRWIARELFDWFEEEGVDAEVALAEAAAAAGITTPRAVRSAGGRVVERVGGSRWRVFEHLVLGPAPTTPADPRHAAMAGRIVARVQGLGLPAPQPVQRWLTYTRDEAEWRRLEAASTAARAPWAERLGEVIPTLVDVTGIVEPADRAGEPRLSACHYAPNAFRVAGADDLAVMTWEHAGAMPPRWDLGTALAGWSVGVAGQVNTRAVEALLTGFAELAAVPGDLDLGIFSADVCANLNWLATRITIALDASDPAAKAEAARAVPTLLVDPPSRPKLEAVLDAIT